jgi:hypothetical protein
MRWITAIAFWALLAFFIMGVLGSIDVVGPRALTAAKRAKAQNEISQITTACENYKNEYFVLPDSTENYRLTKVLCGDNPRKIAFLTPGPSDMNANGELIDPWGTPFRITFDAKSGPHAVSAGPDKIFGTKDDITNQ